MTGFNQAKTILDKMPNKIDRAMNKVMENGIRDIANDSDSKMPNDLKLQGGSTWVFESPDKPASYSVFVNRSQAAYYEFGTGTRDTVKTGLSAEDYLPNLPQDWQDYAELFLGKSFPYTGSIPAHPFLYPTVQANAPKIFKAASAALLKLL